MQYRIPVALFDACRSLGIKVIPLRRWDFPRTRRCHTRRQRYEPKKYLLQHNPDCNVVRPSLIFGSEGPSSRFFLALAALPVHVDVGYEPNPLARASRGRRRRGR
jgi:hypothetical protein